MKARNYEKVEKVTTMNSVSFTMQGRRTVKSDTCSIHAVAAVSMRVMHCNAVKGQIKEGDTQRDNAG